MKLEGFGARSHDIGSTVREFTNTNLYADGAFFYPERPGHNVNVN